MATKLSEWETSELLKLKIDKGLQVPSVETQKLLRKLVEAVASAGLNASLFRKLRLKTRFFFIHNGTLGDQGHKE